jgi:hypothetical protein
VVVVVAAWVLRQLLRKSISTCSGSSWSTLVFTRHRIRRNHHTTNGRPIIRGGPVRPAVRNLNARGALCIS